MKRGVLITFEGLEGSGKTTQLDNLNKALQKHKFGVVKTFEPGAGSQGKAIRHLLTNLSTKDMTPETELFLFLADRSQHIKEIILPALRKKQIVLCDRFIDSTIAYQAYGRNLPITLLEGMNKLASGGLEPDLTLFLDLPIAEGLKRVHKRKKSNRLDRETLTFYDNVRKGYYNLAKRHGRIKIMNALLKRKELEKHIWNEIAALLQEQNIR